MSNHVIPNQNVTAGRDEQVGRAGQASQDFKNAVLNRVRTVYVIRRVLNLLGFKLGWLVVLLLAFGWLVSVVNVLRNFLNTAKDFNGAFDFVTSAFLNADLVVQAISVGIVAVGVFFVFDLYKTLTILRSSSRSGTV